MSQKSRPCYPSARPDDVVIAGGARTPQGKLNGQLAHLTAVELGAATVSGALEKAGIDPAEVDAVILGQVVQAGAGQNPAKQTSLLAGIRPEVAAVTTTSQLLLITEPPRPPPMGYSRMRSSPSLCGRD